MPMTNSERGKKYREKQKLLNLDEYREKERQRNKLNYKKLKNETIKEDNDINIDKQETKKQISILEDERIDNEENEDDVVNNKKPKYLSDLNIIKIDDLGFVIYKPIKKRLNILNKSQLQPQTIKLYFNCFKKVYNSYKQEEMNEKFQEELMKLLENTNCDMEYIKKNLSFLKTDLYIFIKLLNKNELQYIYSILTRIKGFSAIIKRMYPYIIENQIEYQQARDNKEMDKLDKIKYNRLSFIKDDVMKIINENSSLTKRDKLIYGLFMLFPVRRPIDYQRMYLIDKEPYNEEKKEIYKRNNYYYNGIFYFFRTKTKEIQRFIVPKELDELIKDYIEERNLGSFLLDNENKEYEITTFRIHIMKVFNKIYDISFSAVELRQYYSTFINYLVKNKQMTIEEHRNICYMMNHSYEENKKYSYLL
jgi:hypothetical protein